MESLERKDKNPIAMSFGVRQNQLYLYRTRKSSSLFTFQYIKTALKYGLSTKKSSWKMTSIILKYYIIK